MPEDGDGVITLTSDDDDDVVLRPQGRSVAPERRGSQAARPKRRLAVNLLPERDTTRRRASKRLQQENVVDLTSLPDDEVLLVGSSSASKKRRKTTVVVPDSPQSQGRRASKCGICFHDMVDRNMACGPCGHVFCEDCLKQAVKTQKKCPTCRRSLQARQIHRVYLPDS